MLFYVYTVIAMLITCFIFFCKIEGDNTVIDMSVDEVSSLKHPLNTRLIVEIIAVMIVLLWPLFMPFFIIKLIKGKN